MSHLVSNTSPADSRDAAVVRAPDPRFVHPCGVGYAASVSTDEAAGSRYG